MKIFLIWFAIIISNQLSGAYRFNNWWSPTRKPKQFPIKKDYKQIDTLSSESLAFEKWLPMINQENERSELEQNEPELELPQYDNNLNEDKNLKKNQSLRIETNWNQNGHHRLLNGHQSFEEKKFEKKHSYGYDDAVSSLREIRWDDKEEYPTTKSNLNPTLWPSIKQTLKPSLEPTTLSPNTFRPKTHQLVKTTQTFSQFEDITSQSVTSTIKPLKQKNVKNWLDMSKVIKPTTINFKMTPSFLLIDHQTEPVTEQPFIEKKKQKKVHKNLETTTLPLNTWTQSYNTQLVDSQESSTIATEAEKMITPAQSENLKKRKKKKTREHKNNMSLKIDSSTLQPTQGFNLENLKLMDEEQRFNQNWQVFQDHQKDGFVQVTRLPSIQKKRGIIKEDERPQDFETVLTNKKLEPFQENLEPIEQKNVDLDDIIDDSLLISDPKMRVNKRQSLFEVENNENKNQDFKSNELKDSIPGVPGQDYSIYYQVPKTNFKCSEQAFPGYYVDIEFKCQVFHLCQEDGRQDSFVCPVGTLFNQATFVCDWWFNVNCGEASQYFGLNENLYEPKRLSSASENTNVLAKRDYLLESREEDAKVDLKPESIESKERVYFDEVESMVPEYTHLRPVEESPNLNQDFLNQKIESGEYWING